MSHDILIQNIINGFIFILTISMFHIVLGRYVARGTMHDDGCLPNVCFGQCMVVLSAAAGYHICIKAQCMLLGVDYITAW